MYSYFPILQESQWKNSLILSRENLNSNYICNPVEEKIRWLNFNKCFLDWALLHTKRSFSSVKSEMWDEIQN